MHRLGIWLMALALVFNGVTVYAWSDAAGVVAAIAQDHHDSAEASECDVHSADVVAGAVDSGQAQHPMHNHLKCCGTCNIVSLAPNVAVIPVTFSFRMASFRKTHHDLVGHPVALDPDIPKSIV